MALPPDPLTAHLPQRCPWAISPLMIRYHDDEWGTPLHDDRRLFEFLILEGAQAGLSWETILRKRDAYRAAFAAFVPPTVAAYTATDQARLLTDPGIIRNERKIAAAIQNARATLALQATYGSLDAYLWRFVDGRPQRNGWRSIADIPTHTAASAALSRDLKHHGFTFVGATTCYSFMQATGMVNDHILGCARYAPPDATA